jgi:hypothetical protein
VTVLGLPGCGHGWASLNPTEQQVGALIADGLTNAQISATPNTQELHSSATSAQVASSTSPRSVTR